MSTIRHCPQKIDNPSMIKQSPSAVCNVRIRFEVLRHKIPSTLPALIRWPLQQLQCRLYSFRLLIHVRVLDTSKDHRAIQGVIWLIILLKHSSDCAPTCRADHACGDHFSVTWMDCRSKSRASSAEKQILADEDSRCSHTGCNLGPTDLQIVLDSLDHQTSQ